MTYFGLTDWGVINWAIVFIALFGVSGAARWVSKQLPKQQAVRCPDTGVIALVETRDTYPESGTPGIRVLSCELWPQYGTCSRGCLSRDRGGH